MRRCARPLSDPLCTHTLPAPPPLHRRQPPTRPLLQSHPTMLLLSAELHSMQAQVYFVALIAAASALGQSNDQRRKEL
jgi:hypothetical protein